MMIRRILWIALVYAMFFGVNNCFAQTTLYFGDKISNNDVESYGDGASASADVTMEFNMGRIVILSLHDSNSFPYHPYFGNLAFDSSDKFSEPSVFHIVFDGTTGDTDFGDQRLSRQGFKINGAIYTNADNLFVEYRAGSDGIFYHESDPNSWIKVWRGGGPRGFYKTDNGEFAHLDSKSIPVSQLMNNNYILRFSLHRFVVMSSIDANDRAGRYWGSTTITATIQ